MTEDLQARQPTSDMDRELLCGPTGLVRMSMRGIDLGAYAVELLERAKRDAGDHSALMDLSTLVALRGNAETALAVQALALKERQFYRIPAANGCASIRLLALMIPGSYGDNTPLDALVEHSDIELRMLYLIPGLPLPTSVPDHDVAFVAVGQSAAAAPVLQQIEQYVRSWPRPLLNRPERICQLSRDRVSVLLKGVPGLVVPMVAQVERGRLERASRRELPVTELVEDGAWPLLIRPVDSHGGRGLVKIDVPSAILDYLRSMPDTEHFFVARFIDYSKSDGLFRKYRIALIDKRPFACHAAIDSHWMIHYVKAGMEQSTEKRAEEERFMTHFEDDFARRHRLAFDAIDERLGLDYLTMDCSETREGELLFFEADGSSFVHAIDPVDVFPYKEVQMRKVFAAFRDMLVRAMNG